LKPFTNKINVLAAVLGVIFLLSACKHEDPSPLYHIGFSQCCNDAWRDVMNGEMTRELLVQTELELIMKVAQNNSDQQIEQIRALVAEGIDILIVSPNESRPLTPVIEEVYKAGIPVILIDRKIDSDLYTAYIGADNTEVGETAGLYIASIFEQGGEILEIQLPLTISPAVGRSNGFRKGIATTPGLDIVATLETVNGLEDIADKFPSLLQEHPEVDILFAHSDLLAEYAYPIIQQQGRADSMFLLGIDGIPGTGRGIQAVEDGILDASMLYPTGGSEAIRLAKAILEGLPFKKENTLETIVINKTNATILHNQMKKVFSLQESIDEQVALLDNLQVIYRNQRVYIFVLLSSLLLAVILGVFLWRSLRAKQAAVASLEAKNREISAHEQQLIQMSEEVRAATQAKVDFYTNISHEFRTPLTLILGFVEDLLPTQKVHKEVQQSIHYIRQNALRLLRLVNQLMDFRKVESGQMKLRAAEANVTDFVRNIIQSFTSTARKRKIDLQLSAPQEELQLWFDAGMLDKVLFNLLSNSFKFTPDRGRVHLSVSADRVKGHAILSVEDNGRGMSTEEVRQIFEPFYQGEQQQLTGTGLGLSLSRSLVELHGGRIHVQSAPGKGSRFSIFLPLGADHLTPEQRLEKVPDYTFSSADSELMQIAKESISAPRSPGVLNHQILIIEDNEDLQFFLKRKLAASYQILQANSGNDGLKMAFDFTPDLIICDLMLPGMDGLEVVQTLKLDIRTSHIPLIILSARSSTEQQIIGMSSRADAYITKPFDVAFLQAQIQSLLFNREILKSRFAQGEIEQVSVLADLDLPDNISSIDRGFIHRFAAYINEHHTRQDFQVTDLCMEFGLSRSQLYRKIKALLGESIGSYIESVRLRNAEQLLQDKALSVAEVAYQVGYSSPDYFSTVFKSRYGLSPTQFRKARE
jgi:signal transduction histidine kinase/DNA-binding response OmpR family regulator